MKIRKGESSNLYQVESESTPDKWYSVFADGKVIKCTCRAYLTQKTCKHIPAIQQFLMETDGARESEEEGMIVPPASENIGLAKWIKKIHGKDFIQYEGLLAMAHEQGLQNLSACFTQVDDKLAIARAEAIFKDGRTFIEMADATPQNVHAQVKAHFPRVALTRAKARTLRDALNIGTVSVEELDEPPA